MTIPAALAHVEYFAAGVASYVYPFQIDLSEELEVRLDGNLFTEDVHYTVSNVGFPGGGSVTFLNPPTGGVLSLRRVVDIEQLLDLLPNTALPAVALEDQLDEIVKQVQMLEETDSRTPSLPVGTPSYLRYLEFPPPGANGIVGWNATGTALTLYPTGITSIPVNPLSGIGSGKNVVAVTPAVGEPQATALLFPPGVLAVAVTVWLQTGFGTSQGLHAIGIGTPEHPDRWGYLTDLDQGTETTAGVFQDYSGQPQESGGVVSLTSYGGLFDGVGTAYVTGHFLTFAPSHSLGFTFDPGAGAPPVPAPPSTVPLATETVPGIVELINPTEVLADVDTTRALTIARLITRTSTEGRVGLNRFGTTPESVTGTLTTVSTHPAGVRAAINARTPVTGTPLSVYRLNAAANAAESAPLSVDASGNVLLGTVTAGASAQRAVVIASGVAPTTSPVDAAQWWVADQEGTANQAALHIRSEDGFITRIGHGLTSMMRARLVSANGSGAPLALTVDMSGTYFICQGAAEQYLQLPTAGSTTVGCWYRLSQHGTNGARVIAAAGATIQLAGTVTAAGGFFRTVTAGNYMIIVQANTNYWFIMSPVQNWGVV